MKQAKNLDIYSAAKEFRSILNSDVLLIINDHIDIALLTADGIHVGQDDLPVKDIRSISPHKFIIGCSCHNLAEAQQAQVDGASYISMGSVFHTETKLDATRITMTNLDEISNNIHIPICAIGGINQDNINELSATKINMFAMHNGIWNCSAE